MTKNRWILPDGIEEILPNYAWKLEDLRRRLLDNLREADYQLIIPPLVEFSDSLLTGLGEDLDLQTFKMVDQISGKTLGLRSDISPQAARIDAHSLDGDGVRRLCYAGSTLRTLPSGVAGSRAPIQVGAEIFGDSSEAADEEILLLMLQTLEIAGVSDVTLDIGHVGIADCLLLELEQAGVATAGLIELIQNKQLPDLQAWLGGISCSEDLARIISRLPSLCGDTSILGIGRDLFGGRPAIIENLDRVERLSKSLHRAKPDIKLFIDLGAARGSNYHSGLIFAAYAAGHGCSIANGGRYDDVGADFGRARPATGFSADLRSIIRAADRLL